RSAWQIEETAMADEVNIEKHKRVTEESCAEIQAFVSRPKFTVRQTATRFCEFEPHSHTAFTVTAVLSGRMEATIGATDFELSAGDVVLTGVGQTHAARAFDIDFVSINISPVLVNELVTEIGLTRATAEIVFREGRVR